jgi:hypothetical protein
MPELLQETAVITEAAAAAAAESGRMRIQFISPGWGSSGYYSPQVLEQAVTDRVIPAGTHMYADHPTETEDLERPVRSIKDLMAVTVEDALLRRRRPGRRRPGRPAVARPPRDRPRLDRGLHPRVRHRHRRGRGRGPPRRDHRGPRRPGLSVDFVTRAGRGGKILPLLESARVNKRAIGHGIAEATVNDTREALQTVLRDTYGGDKVYVWVRDFDDTTVWFEVESDTDSGCYGQSYTSTTARSR